jgi:hypothetical protein
MEELSFLGDKNLKPKEKTEKLSRLLLDKILSSGELAVFAEKSKDPVKATCIEALEYASKEKPETIHPACFDFVTLCLADKAPRIKWESARVIGNTAHRFPGKLDPAVKNLLANTGHTGTVVRWSAAFALGQIIRLKTPVNDSLVPAVRKIVEKEEKNSIRKIYLDAMKKAGV